MPEQVIENGYVSPNEVSHLEQFFRKKISESYEISGENKLSLKNCLFGQFWVHKYLNLIANRLQNNVSYQVNHFRFIRFNSFKMKSYFVSVAFHYSIFKIT